MRPGRRTIGAVAVAAGAGLLGGVALQLRRTLPDVPAPPGRYVDVKGESVHILSNADGEGPTVVFESAMASPCTEWAWVLRALDGKVPYVAYDRPGNGWSSRRTAPDLTADYHGLTAELLRALGLPAPYLLVGHSVGGLLIRDFAARRPRDTAGLVLVDSSHPDQLERSSQQRDGMALVRHALTNRAWRARFGRVECGKDDFGAVADLPKGVAGPTVGVMCRPEPWVAALRELELWHRRWAADVRGSDLSDGVPVAVVTAGKQAEADPAHAQMQRELARLSPVARHETVAAAEHDALVMQQEHAARVSAAVTWALDTAREREVHR